MKIRRMAAVTAAKFTGYICKKMGRQGVTWAGKIALKICPDILEQLSAQVREKIYVVCGTNGKTTTNNMLCAALEKEGKKVICNHTGSNMLNGVVAAFVLGAKWNGTLDADYACIEVDEASTKYIFPAIRPDYMVMTNLFRDQLDRYGEIDITMNILEEMMRKVPDMKVIVNGDDALSAYLAMDSGNPYVTYGISRPVVQSAANEIREGRFCKKCGERLQYSFYHYSQLGDYKCPKCGFQRPELQYDAFDVKVGEQLSFRVEDKLLSVSYTHLITSRDGELSDAVMASIGDNMEQYGVDLLLFETKQLDLPEDNKDAVYERMISERDNIAATYKAQGSSEAKVIRNTTDKEIAIKISEAEKKAEILRAEGEQEYMKILAQAYGETERSEFYSFVRSLDALKNSMKGEDKTVILSEDSPIAQIFQGK